MPKRPYFTFSGDQIHQVFVDNQNNMEVLKQVLTELQHRSTIKMKALHSKVEERISELAGSTPRSKNTPPPENAPPRKNPHQSQSLKPDQKGHSRMNLNHLQRTINPQLATDQLNQKPAQMKVGMQRKSLLVRHEWGRCVNPENFQEFQQRDSLI